jgi:hypothetical protein
MAEQGFKTFRGALCLIVAATTSNSFASPPSEDASDSNVQAQLESMKSQMDAIRQENQAMKSEIDDLRAKTDADWLTEARAEEIRGLVADVLADADSRASLLQDGMMAGWSDHFFLADPNGRFKLELQGMMQFRWIYNYMERDPNPFSGGDRDQHREGFENTRTRLTFRGYVFSPDIEYLVRGDFARNGGNFGLLDAWIRYQLTDEWGVRFGQFKLPYNREELVQPQEQLAVERSLVNELFNVGRSQGIELTYSNGASRFMLATSDGGSGPAGGAGNRQNQTALTQDTEYSFTGRYEHLLSGEWRQFTDFTSPPGDPTGALWGIAGHFEESESGAPAFTQTTTRIVAGTTDLSFEWGGASAFGALHFTYVDSPSGMTHFTGIMGQVAMYVAPKWELFARGEYMNFEFGSGSFGALSDVGIASAGFNYYIEGHDLKWTTDISFGLTDIKIAAQFADPLGFRSNADDTWPQIVFRTQFQLLF